MARTRASKPAPSGDAATTAADTKSVPAHVLPAQTTNPQKLLVLPRAASRDAKVVSLPNPRHSKPTRYLACPDTGLYEFTKISAPKTAPRSWLIETRAPTQDAEPPTQRNAPVDGHIVKTADLYVATPIDPLFLIIPALTKPSPKSDAKRLFVSSEDHFDSLPDDASHLSAVLCFENMPKLFEARMRCVCDTVQVRDDTMFRVNDGKLLGELIHKARRMAEGSLPQSMEEKFVKKALEAPILSQRQRKLPTRPAEAVAADASTPAVLTPSTDSGDSQASTAAAESSTSAESQVTTVATSVAEGEEAEDTVKPAIEASDEVLSLQRIKVAFEFLCASYIPIELSKRLAEMLKDGALSKMDFGPLEDYLAQLAKLRTEVMASRSMGDYSKKHPRDEEEDEVREEKKRKVEEEKKKKALESRGVRNLRKVDTTGMRKMSDFFKKK